MVAAILSEIAGGGVQFGLGEGRRCGHFIPNPESFAPQGFVAKIGQPRECVVDRAITQ